MFPSFIVTTSNFVATYSASKGLNVVSTGDGTYYGLTWDKKDIFIMRKCDAYGGKRSLDTPVSGDLYKIDSDYRFSGEVVGEFPGAHSMVYRENKVYVTASAINGVIVSDTETATLTFKNWTAHNLDTNHINSIWPDPDGSFWCTYHNWTSKSYGNSCSYCVNLNGSLTEVLRTVHIGLGVHNCVRLGSVLYVCSSQDGYLILYDLFLDREISRKYVGKWVRGIGITEDNIVLGVTPPSGRASRDLGSSEVLILDRKSLDEIHRVEIEGSGSLYELRVIGEADYAHNGISFPGTFF